MKIPGRLRVILGNRRKEKRVKIVPQFGRRETDLDPSLKEARDQLEEGKRRLRVLKTQSKALGRRQK